MKIGFSNLRRPMTNLLLNVFNDSADCCICCTIDKFFLGFAGTGQQPANLKPILRVVGGTFFMRALLSGKNGSIVVDFIFSVVGSRGEVFSRILVDIFNGVLRDLSAATDSFCNLFR